MTSRELTSGFDFWSSGHLRIAVMHLPIKFGADVFIQSGVVEIKDGGRRHLGFVGKPWDHPRSVFVVRTACKNFVVIG